MGSLSVEIRLFDQVIEHRVLPPANSILLGDSPDAKVVFPYPPFPVLKAGKHFRVLGAELAEGDDFTLEVGTFQVVMTHTPAAWRQWGTQLEIDPRFFAVTLVMVLSGGWIDAADHWLGRQPWVTNDWLATQRWYEPNGNPKAEGAPEAAVVRVSTDLEANHPQRVRRADGPQHLSDDRVTGVGYHRWFKQVVPKDPNAFQADIRLELDPDDIEARRIVGRAAYNQGRFSLASWHYQQILDRYPDDHHARLRLAWAERRQGHHQAEYGLYSEILTTLPAHVLALGGSSMAAARLGRFVEAQRLLEVLHVVAPTDPYTDLTSAVLESARGQDREALRSIRRTIERRDLFDEELQVELRRDIATDPSFAALRSHWRLRAVLRRHFAAASPRGTR